jgi:MFS family permease
VPSQDPDSRVALGATLIAAAFVAIPLYVAPALATSYVNELGFQSQQPGYVISVEMAGMGLATFPALWWVNRLHWPRLARAMLLVLIVANVICMTVRTPADLAAVRFLSGLAAGTVSIVCMSALRLTANPERSFATWLIAQLAVGALCLALLPSLLAYGGTAAVFGILALAAACLIWPVGSIHDGSAGPLGAQSSAPAPTTVSASGILGLGALLAFYVAFSCVWAFASQIAVASGIAPASAAHILSLAPIAGVLGAALAAVCGQRLGRVVPLGLGMLTLAAAVFRLSESVQLASFLVASAGLMFAWTFVVPYLLGGIASSDHSGRLTVATNVIIGLGLTLGPALGGEIVAHGSYRSVAQLPMVLCLVSFLMSLPLARRRV